MITSTFRLPQETWPALRAALATEVHVWRWRGPRRDPAIDALVAAYLDLDARDIQWTLGEHGKPTLEPGRLEVNWSHCDGELILVLAHGAAVGVDIEMPRPLRRRAGLLARAFTVNERAALSHAPDVDVLKAWAHKEALVKAIGRGIAYGLKRIELDLTGAEPRLAGLEGAAAPASSWQVVALPQGDASLAAAAYRGTKRLLRQFRMDATGNAIAPS